MRATEHKDRVLDDGNVSGYFFLLPSKFRFGLSVMKEFKFGGMKIRL